MTCKPATLRQIVADAARHFAYTHRRLGPLAIAKQHYCCVYCDISSCPPRKGLCGCKIHVMQLKNTIATH